MRARPVLPLGLAVVAMVPGIVLRATGSAPAPELQAALFGLAIVGAAFLLSWAAEVAQLDISAGLAIAVLAFIAVLPEYAVDLVFALKGGDAYEAAGYAACPGPPGEGSPCSLALANMTGSNRLLIGVGWSVVVFLAWRKGRQRAVTLDRSFAVELSFLMAATAWSVFIALRRSVTLLDAAVLVALFVAYTWRISKAPAEEPDLVGPAAWIGGFSTARRRATVVAFFLVAAGTILLTAEGFAEALVATGRSLGISEFLLVQWLAPLASEAPELLVAGLYATRLATGSALSTLVSSKVNQWTLLVGTLPIAFAVASASSHGLPIGSQQRQEIFLTAAFALLACSMLLKLSLSAREAQVLFGLYLLQLVATAVGPDRWHGPVRLTLASTYAGLAVLLFLRQRRAAALLLRDGFRTSYEELSR